MKKTILLFLSFSCSILLLGQTNKPATKLEVWSPTYPVLIGKDHNPVLRIQIDIADGQRSPILREVVLSLAGSDQVEDVEQVSLFFTGSSPNFDTKQPLVSSVTVQQQIRFSLQTQLQSGTNYFWISYRLAEQADLLHKLGAQLIALTIDKKTIENPDDSPTALKRIALALRKHQQDGIHTYRIPGIVTTNTGALIAVYDNRRNGSVDLQEDVDVGMSRSTDGGQSWEPMKVIMDMGEWGGKPQEENGIGDPAVLVDQQTNTIWVAGIWAHGHPGKRNWWASKQGIKPSETSQLMLTKSDDDGLTWSSPINLTPIVKDPKWHLLLQGPGRGISMKNGTLVFPAQYKDENGLPHSTILYSEDHGKNWELGTGAKSNTTESQVVELSDGALMLNMRDNRGNGPKGKNGSGSRSVAITKDLGKTWMEHPSSRQALIEPVCNAGLLKHSYKGEDLLLFINPHDKYVRQNMMIKVSMDEGMNWPNAYYTLIDEGRGRGYPSLTSIDENTIGLLYEGSQADLIFQKITLKELLKKN